MVNNPGPALVPADLLCHTDEQALDLFPSPSLSKVLGNIISEPEHKL